MLLFRPFPSMATRDSASLQDDGFREIQLTGKQLVFLFMATTVVSIVIFLCGVLVGRGVRGDVTVAQRSSSTQPPAEPPAGEPEPVDEVVAAEELKNPTQLPQELTYQQRLDGNGAASGAKPAAPVTKPPATAAAANAAAPAASTTPPAPAPAPPASASSAKTDGSPAAARGSQPSAETSKTPAATKPTAEAKSPAPSSPPAAAPSTNADKTSAAAASSATTTSTARSAAEKAAENTAKPAPPASAASAGAFVVQVAALDNRREADQIAQRLSAKGYPAFVQEPAAGSQDKFFRVRVGRFADRPSAERTVKQLAQEGPYKPWITR